MKNLNVVWVLCMSALLSSAVLANEVKLSSKKARIVCEFAKNNLELEKITINADLGTKTARVVQHYEGDGDNGNDRFSILTHSRASDSKDRETLREFSPIADSRYNSSDVSAYKAPATLVLAGNNGDDTDQTLVLQYRGGANDEKELKDGRARGESDFTDINLVYLASCDGNLAQPLASKTCKMNLE